MRPQHTIAGLTLLASLISAAPTCTNYTIPVTISATNVQVPSVLDIDHIETFLAEDLASLINIPVNGTYNIFGSYCEPEVDVADNKDVLQLLVHGIFSTHHYFSGDDFNGTSYHGSNYSWVDYASQQGYPTLSIDRLGNGLSSHPDPLLVVQMPAQVEVTHQLVKSINAGFLGRNFSEVVYIGHSWGSVLGQNYVAKYPDDISRIVLTGWAALSLQIIEGVLGFYSGIELPAALAYPSLFSDLPLGYLAETNVSAEKLTYYGFDTSFAGKYYDPTIPLLEFDNPATGTLGEVYTVAVFLSTEASSFTGKVLVSTGQHDAFFCGYLTTADCGQGASSLPAESQHVFPSAASFDYFIPENTGHETLFHYTQKETFANAFGWLESTA